MIAPTVKSVGSISMFGRWLSLASRLPDQLSR